MNSLEYAIVKVSACGIFAEPTFKSEMVSQVLENEKVQVIDKKDDWFQVRLISDGYKGWVHRMYFDDLDSSESYLKDMEEEQLFNFPIIKTAYQMLGAPYLWGGRSPQGYDCSGLVQTTMNLLGFDFPRDAKDQVESKLLREIKIEDTSEQDFLFFEEKNIVSHIAISISKNINSDNNSDYIFYIIHSSGTVRISQVVFDKSLYAFIDGRNRSEIKLHKVMRLKNRNE